MPASTVGSSEEGTIPFDRELEHGGEKRESRKHFSETTYRRLASGVISLEKPKRDCLTVTKTIEKRSQYERLGIMEYGKEGWARRRERASCVKWRVGKKKNDAYPSTKTRKSEKKYVSKGPLPFHVARALPWP
ncbi:hypothetical protein ACLOJK_012571 [Asimina triloba]